MKTAPRKENQPATGLAGIGARMETVGGMPIIGPAPGQGGRMRRASAEKTTVLLVDDSAAVRRSLCTLLETEGHSEVVGQARNGREAVEMARTMRPDVILMDIAMPVLNGLEATRQILAANPAAKVLILSAHSDDEYIERLTAVGAAGFLEKLRASEILPEAIREVARGNLFFSPAIAKRMAHGKK